ncbi:MAG TPA: aminotransferase class IV [Terriglobia bacterium]|nr:aminotransferase class IV [Terriglobia bacterium]
MDSLIFHNGRIVPLKEVHLSPGQVGLLTGWGVFTTLRIYRGLPFAFERHWKRMGRDAERLQLSIEYSEETVRRAVEELARANHRPEGMARVSFVKNSGGLWSQADDLPPTDLLIFTRELTAWPVSHRLRLQPMGIFAGGQYAGAKMLSWVPHAAVLERTHGEGFDDALLLNERGQLAECTSANIFLVREGRVLTPPLSSGCLAGITREVLLEVAPLAGVELVEQELTPADLSSADEVFVSSTTREVAAVGTISPNWTYPAPGKTTQALENAFTNYVHAYLDQASLRT